MAMLAWVTNCPGMTVIVPESQVCVPHPEQKQSGTMSVPEQEAQC